MKCCQHRLKTCFRKRLKFIVIIQDMQPTKTTLYNKFQQTLAKKTISHRGAALWENADQQFKDKPTPLVINPDHFCCCNMDECLKNYTTGYI